jgi:hypothetical protein
MPLPIRSIARAVITTPMVGAKYPTTASHFRLPRSSLNVPYTASMLGTVEK